MKKQRNLLITLIAFFVLILGAYILYNRLSEDYKPNSLLATPGTTSENVQSDTAETDMYHTDSAETSADTSAGDEISEETAESPEPELQPAPDFTVYDYDGNAVTLSDFVGKPVVLNFWASWCGPCKMEMPEFDAAYAEMGEDVQFMVVNLTDGARETVDVAKTCIDSEGYSFPVFYDTDIDAAMKYSVSSIPATYFIDKDGYLIAYGVGTLDGETLAKGIGMIYTPEE